MNDREIRKEDEVEIDLGKILKALIGKVWVLMLSSAAGAAAALLITLLIMPQYQSSAMFYVNNNAFPGGDGLLSSITSADIAASKELVDSYIVILQSRESLEAVIERAGVARSYEEVKKMISASAINSTGFFEVVVTGSDPQETERIANAIVQVLPERISGIMEGASAKIVDSATAASKPSSPGYLRNAMLGFLLGLFLAADAVSLQAVLDTTIRTREDIKRNCTYPVLAEVPSAPISGKGGKLPVDSGMEDPSAEAYKLLRTKLQCCFGNDDGSHVIGITSVCRGEGKSQTAINLAHSLAQLGKKVILIDCDLRQLPRKENKGNAGLSDFLTGQCSLKEIVRCCGMGNERTICYVIPAGQKPPNPTELLSAQRMSKALMGLRKICDYVILDLPPVGEVSDALAVAKETDGILLAARSNRCNRTALRDAMEQFEFVNARILGVVYHCAAEGSRNGK